MSTSVIAPDSTAFLPSEAAGLYKICENCARNYFRCQESSQRTRWGQGENQCCACRYALTTSGHQLWACRECGMVRSWGSNRPEETAHKLLNCEHCLDVTEHRFEKVVA